MQQPNTESEYTDILPDPWSMPGRSWRAFLRDAWSLTRPYFLESEERWRACAFIVLIVILNLGTVYMSVQFNQWYNGFYNSLQEKNTPAFWEFMQQFAWLAAIAIALAVYKFYVTQLLDIRWRAWMTKNYLTLWLGRYRYYHLELLRQSGAQGLSDNPDQRIQEDIGAFTSSTLGMTMGLLNATVTLVSFIGILWTLSGSVQFTLWGAEYTIPGYMVWVAIIYCFIGSILAHYIGRRLVRLNFWQQWREADFRYGLVRVREYAEAIAFDKGEAVAQRHLHGRFAHVIQNSLVLIGARKRLIWFTSFFQQAAIIFPFLVAAPRYFAGSIKLGDLIQISSAFGKVQDALSWFIDSYPALASWRATTERLTGFDRGVLAGQTLMSAPGVTNDVRAIPDLSLNDRTVSGDTHDDYPVFQHQWMGDSLIARDVRCYLPGGRLQVQANALCMQPGDTVLVQGESGSGKSTLLRVLAGIWPLAAGQVVVPQHSMFLPQRPYLPVGTLHAALAYPEQASLYGEAQMQAVLQQVRMPHLVGQLQQSENWGQKLSGGEQQRVAIARALLKQPAWIFADEATSALDAATEAQLYQALMDMTRANGGGMLSVAHRESVAAWHARRWLLQADDTTDAVDTTAPSSQPAVVYTVHEVAVTPTA